MNTMIYLYTAGRSLAPASHHSMYFSVIDGPKDCKFIMNSSEG